MSKEKKDKDEKKKRGKRGKYDPKLSIKGSFADVIKIAVEDEKKGKDKQ